MQDKIVETLETVLATIFVGFGGFIFVKDILISNENEEEETELWILKSIKKKQEELEMLE